MTERIQRFLMAFYGVDAADVSSVGNDWYVTGEYVGTTDEQLDNIYEMNITCRHATGCSAGL